jgi:hypothetical protein
MSYKSYKYNIHQVKHLHNSKKLQTICKHFYEKNQNFSTLIHIPKNNNFW